LPSRWDANAVFPVKGPVTAWREGVVKARKAARSVLFLIDFFSERGSSGSALGRLSAAVPTKFPLVFREGSRMPGIGSEVVRRR
jgi:hypothetical protein